MPDAHVLIHKKAKWTVKPDPNYSFGRGNNAEMRS
jgi:hypothetical protein